MTIGVKLDKKWTGPDHGEHGVCAYNGSLGQSPQRDPGAEPLVRGSAENFLRIRHPRKGQTGGLIVMNVIWYTTEDSFIIGVDVAKSGGSEA